LRQYSFLLDTLDRKPPPVAFTAPAAAADAAAPKPAEAATPAAAPAEAPRTAAHPKAGGDYAVQAGDSLLKIAQATRYDGVSLSQMVVAIYRTNEDAFVGGDMSRLKSGRMLKIPGRDAVAAVNADEARQAVAALRGQPEPTRAATREPGLAGDDLVARDRALTESRERVTALEQTRDDLQRLIEARNREIVELERQVGGKGAAKSQPSKKLAP
jgi:FimV-like protein